MTEFNYLLSQISHSFNLPPEVMEQIGNFLSCEYCSDVKALRKTVFLNKKSFVCKNCEDFYKKSVARMLSSEAMYHKSIKMHKTLPNGLTITISKRVIFR